MSSQTISTYQARVVCNNCGGDSVEHEIMGVPIRKKLEDRECIRCHCREGFRILPRG